LDKETGAAIMEERGAADNEKFRVRGVSGIFNPRCIAERLLP
jgi:hypothetical protein